jgi:hypothetical protein
VSKASVDVAATGAADGTIRIEHDRRRLALAAAASGLAMLLVPCMFIVSSLHPGRAAPTWTLAPLGVALLVAALGFVRSIIRLQDGDPALVVSPRGLNFRPYLFGEIARIPWRAISGFKSRSYKHQRFIVLQVDDIDRYAPRVGFAPAGGGRARTRSVSALRWRSRRGRSSKLPCNAILTGTVVQPQPMKA